MRKEYEKRRDIVYEEILKIEGAFTKKPEGAFYTVVKLPVESAENFAKWLLESYSVNGYTTMVAPAEGFYATPGRGKNEIRIAYVLNTDELKKAMGIIRSGVLEYAKIENRKCI